MMNTRHQQYVKRQLLLGLHSFLYASGLATAYATLLRIHGATVFMYHSVAVDDEAQWIDPRNHISPVVFRKQMAYLARNRHVVSMDVLVNSLLEGRSMPSKSVVITIDDGYRDTLTVAAPILAEYGLPAILYLATGYISRTENQWVDQLYSLFIKRTSNRLILPWECKQYELDIPATCTEVYHSIAEKLITSCYDIRVAVLAEVKAQLRPSNSPPKLTMSWDDVRRLRQEYPLVAVGGHTQNHIDLSSTTVESANREINACVQDIKHATGEPPAHFSYPYNRTAPYLTNILRQNGFASAVASGLDMLIQPGASLYTLARIEAPDSLARLGFYSSGAYPHLSKLLTGRA